MTRSLRRSRREPKKKSDYNVGDIVEINRNDLTLRGRLAQLLTEGTSPNPRWLVKFDGQPQKDEEMYERSFGKLLVSFDDEEPSSAVSSSPVPAVQRKPAKPQGNGGLRGSGGGVGKTSGTSSDEKASDEKAGDEPKTGKPNFKKAVQFEQGSNVTGSDDSMTSIGKAARDRVSARESRSRRRQALIEEDVPLGAGELLAGGTRRVPPPPNHSKKRQRGDDGSDVVKVKLLTGTLYLYRGKQRRAEFIRKV